MKKRTTILATLAMLTFGGYVGYVTNYTKKAIAHEYVIPKFTEIPRNNLNIDINLNKNAIAIKGDNPEQDINVNIQKKDSIVYLTSVVEKKVEVPVYIKVREMPSIKESKTSCTDVLKTIQQQSEKRNLSRNLKAKYGYNAIIGVNPEISKSKDKLK